MMMHAAWRPCQASRRLVVRTTIRCGKAAVLRQSPRTCIQLKADHHLARRRVSALALTSCLGVIAATNHIAQPWSCVKLSASVYHACTLQDECYSDVPSMSVLPSSAVPNQQAPTMLTASLQQQRVLPLNKAQHHSSPDRKGPIAGVRVGSAPTAATSALIGRGSAASELQQKGSGSASMFMPQRKPRVGAFVHGVHQQKPGAQRVPVVEPVLPPPKRGSGRPVKATAAPSTTQQLQQQSSARRKRKAADQVIC